MLFNFKKTRLAIALFNQAYKKSLTRLLFITIFGFLSGILGGIGIGAIIPIFSFINNKGQPTDNISRLIDHSFKILHLHYNLTLLIAFVAAIFILKAIFLYIGTYLGNKITLDYEYETRTEVLKKTFQATWPHLLSQKIGHLTNIVLDDVGGSSSILYLISNTITIAASLITYAFVAFNISFAVTASTFAFGLVFFFVLKPFFYRIRRESQSLTDVNKNISHYINQHILGVKTVKSTGVEEAVSAKSEYLFGEQRKVRIKLFLINGIFSSFFEPVSLIFIFFIFIVFYTRSGIEIASFAAVVYLMQKMFSFMQNIQIKLNSINELVPNLRNVTKYLNDVSANRESAGGSRTFSLKDSVEFQNVNFSYHENEVLSGVTFKIKRGSNVGLIGPSGAGKTTIVDLLLRLFVPESGQILIDGQNISEVSLENWRKHIGYVSQDIFLLNDTIENNIKFYDESITSTELIESAKEANIYDFIMSQPNQFKTIVGERGIHLSAGQRQRVVLARVLVKRPQLLILDEATSALDNESESLIQKSIENLHGKTTILTIAHRLSTVMGSDQLIVLEKGKIIESGSPEKFMENKDSYLYKSSRVGMGSGPDSE